jgi:hypothetical protein
MVSAARILLGGRAFAGSPTGSRPSVGRFGWKALPGTERGPPPTPPPRHKPPVRRRAALSSRGKCQAIFVQTLYEHWKASPLSIGGTGVRSRLPLPSAEKAKVML